MTNSLSKIRDLIIIVGIYLYFIGWVYTHFYYQQFGLSAGSMKVDYASYLVFSYNVLMSNTFLIWLAVFLLLVLVRAVILRIIRTYREKSLFLKKVHTLIAGNIITIFLNKAGQVYSLLLLIIFLVLIFPLLFTLARNEAIVKYRSDRADNDYLKSIQFVFRKDADLLSPAIVLDSAISKNDIHYYDLSVIKNDTSQVLQLLGESESHYIVLHQLPYNHTIKRLPAGYVYFIDKNDILLTKINLRSL